MTIFGQLMHRSIEDPQVPISAANIWSALGVAPTDSGEAVSPATVLGIPAVLRAVKITAGTRAGLPLKVRTSATDESLRKPWQGVSPSTGQTWFERVETATAWELLWGDQFWFKVREGPRRASVVTDLIPIHPARVRVDQAWLDTYKIRWTPVFVLDGKTPLTNYEIMHIPGMSTDGIRGISMVSAERQSLGIALAAERTAANLYGKGMFAPGILTTDKVLREEDAAALKARWRMLNAGGAQAAGDVAVLDNGAKYEQITMPPGDAQFLESRKFSVTEISRMFGMPGWMLNDQEKSTSWGTGMEQQFTTWVMLSVKPDAQRCEQRFTSELCVGDEYAEFVLEGLMRGDSKSRAAFYASGIQNGWLVPNDVRELENRPPVPWGDEPYIPNALAAAPDLSDDSDKSNDDQEPT